MKDSLRYKGSVLWNIVLYQEKDKSFSSSFELRKHVVNRAYFKDFNFNALSVSQPATDIATLYKISF